jgi:HSP90 family molecular chaperone
MKAGRLHLRLEACTVEAIKEYARRRGTTVTLLVQQHFLTLLEEDRLQRVLDAEQI